MRLHTHHAFTRIAIVSFATVAFSSSAVLLASHAAQTTPQTTSPQTTRPRAERPAPASKEASKETLSKADHAFVMEAAQGGMAEVALGKLAAEHASNSAVKQFGQRMVEDHGKANDELKALAQQKGITVPSEPNAKQKATMARLEKLHGDAFDRAYVQDMLKDHKHDVAAFEKQSTGGGDADIKSWAGKTLPTLKEHLQQVESLASKHGTPKT